MNSVSWKGISAFVFFSFLCGLSHSEDLDFPFSQNNQPRVLRASIQKDSIAFSYDFSSPTRYSLGEDGEKLLLRYEDESTCKSVGHTFFGNATHPNGGRNGRLNERNDGYGFTCYLDKQREVNLFLYTLTNSQYGLSIAWGIAIGKTLIDFKGMTYTVGFAPTALSYEKRNNDVLYGVLPLFYERLSWQLPREVGRVSLMQNHLLKGVRLRNIEIEIDVIKLFRLF